MDFVKSYLGTNEPLTFFPHFLQNPHCTVSKYFSNIFFLKDILILFNLLCSIKKGDFENRKVPNRDFSTKSVPDYCGVSNM